ncbi:MAG: TonB-dependent receptor [Dysgonamonadaceae bacterium]|jgi:TonB-linked SusC/RagA family outer membrane protein|nr:TonB-dependent receptor [Dysgonamonadaceae bacterium]
MRNQQKFRLKAGFFLVLTVFGISSAWAQSKTVSGRVTDEKEDPIIGVSVIVKGTSQGVVTNLDGEYTIAITSGNQAVLSFSYLGYELQEIPVGTRNRIDVVMKEKPAALDEVVVIGYGTQKKETLSGAVTSIKGSDVIKIPSMNVSNSLAGSLPGLVVVGQSGEPGADFSRLYIRGQSSLNDNNPLIVVDGVPNRSLERIDPSTIENISVLKDASAAIYGSQAANGVILITTKRGKAEKLNVTLNLSQGWSRPTIVPELTNSAEFATLVNEIKAYRGDLPLYSETDIQKYTAGDDPWRYPNTDWFDAVLKPWSPQSNVNINLSGGTEKLKVFTALSVRSQDGYFKNSGSKYSQYDLRTNVDGEINNYITVSVDMSGRMENADFLTIGSGTLFSNLLTARPTLQAYWPNGLPGPPLNMQNQYNPVVQSTSEVGYNKNENYVFNITGKINIKIPYVEGLSFVATGAIDRSLNYGKKFYDQYTLYTWDGQTVSNNEIPELEGKRYGRAPSLIQHQTIWKEYLVNGLFNYQKEVAKGHDLNILIGLEMIENSSNWFSAERRNYKVSFPQELDFGDPNNQYANGSNPAINRWLNYFGRLNYSFQSKYLLEFVWRYQGTSKFAPQTRWGFFPGISAGYRISEENFWEGNLKETINDLKIRASWGKTGNDLIDPYQYFSLYSAYWRNFVITQDPEEQNNKSTIYESRAYNLQAQWEEADQSNIGIDMNLLKGKLTITADYFNNLRSKILIPQSASVPGSTGLGSILPDVNIGKVRNSGFDFNISYNHKAGDFTYRIGLNGGYAKNKVIFFDEAEGVWPWQSQTGYPMHSYLLYDAPGIFHTQAEIDQWNQYAREKTGDPDAEYITGARPGDIFFRDTNEDGQINGEDKIRIYKNIVPSWTGGLNLLAQYKGFDLNVLFQGQAGAVRYIAPDGGEERNYPKSFYDKRWTEQNPNAEYPRTYNRNDEYWMSSDNWNTFWLKKTDFIRLKNIELGYTIPRKILNKTGINTVRVYVGGMNLFTYAPDMTDFDPEVDQQDSATAGSGYPIQKMVNAGFSINF